MQAHKRLIAKILSLVLTSSMVITTLPLNVLANEEGIESTEPIQEEGTNGSGEVNENTDGSEENNEGTAIFEVEKADAGTNQISNDYDISIGNFKLDAADSCSEDDPHVITGKTTEYYINVESGTHFIKLNNVDITGNGSAAIGINKGATVNLILATGSKNKLKAGNDAGIFVPTNANLVISGDGELESTGSNKAAGIGAGDTGRGNITIKGGIITAIGGSDGAGIGGHAGGDIKITGGTVTANGAGAGAGIGGGYENSGSAGGNLTIDGGTIIATGGSNGGAGIGGGLYGAGGNITIAGGTVTATGGARASGIGGGQGAAGGTISIEGGEVTATGGSSASGIGGGSGAGSGKISIEGGKVTAIGGDYSSGIGGFGRGTNNIDISGGTIIATGGKEGPDIFDGAGIFCGNNNAAYGTITISNANVTAVSGSSEPAIYAATINITSGSIMQFKFDDAVDSGTKIEVKNTSGESLSPNVSYSPTKSFKSIALTVPNAEDYTAYAGTDKLKHTVNSTLSDNFNVIAGLNNYTIVKEVAKQLESIEVTTQPTKTTYTVGESFDETGLIVVAIYTDSTKSPITNYTVDPSGALAASDTKVTISYTEGGSTKTVDVTITVNEASHTHTPSNSWTSDATQHWHACTENDGGKMDIASHTFGEWMIDTQATDTQEGSKHRVCSICQYNESGTIPTLTPTPDTPSTGGSTSDSSNNIEVEGVDTGKNIQVTTSKTPDIVKDVIDDKFIVGTFEIKKATEPVVITIKVDKKKTKDIFVLQSNPETGVLELLTKAEVNKDGKAEFTTDSKEKMTIVTQLYEGFIDTVATIEKPSVTYYVDEDQSFKKGWFLVESKDWYFADYETAIVHKGRWVADGQDNKKLANWYCLDEKGVMFESKWIANNATGSKWYYVDENGLFLRDTVIDGYVINAEGYWSK